MKHYFIDFENVHSDGLNGIETIETGSNVRVLYSDNCKNISLEVLEKATKNQVVLSACKTMVGKNALDFQLATLLGYVIGSNTEKDDEFIIVSKDTGFDAVVEFWKQQNIKITRLCSLEEKPENTPIKKETKKAAKQKKAASDITQTTKEELVKYISKKEYSDEVLKIVNSYKTRTAINNGLVKLYKDSGKAGNLYNKMKPLLKEKGKT